MPFGMPNDYFDQMPTFPAFIQHCGLRHADFADPLDGPNVRGTDFGAPRHLLTMLPPLLSRSIGDSLLETPVSAWY